MCVQVGVFSVFWDGLNVSPYEYTASQDPADPGVCVYVCDCVCVLVYANVRVRMCLFLHLLFASLSLCVSQV